MNVLLFRVLGWLCRLCGRLVRTVIDLRERKVQTVFLDARMVIGDTDLPEM